MKTTRGAVLFFSILVLGSVIFGSGCTGTDKENTSAAAENRVVKSGDTVQVDYTGKLENGTVFDTSREDAAKQAGIYVSARTYAPLEFVVGSGQMIKGFDKGVLGMKAGEEKTIKIPPEEAYGEYDRSKIFTVPLRSLNMTEAPREGQALWDQYGNKVKVLAVNDTDVTLDANHELAGKTLVFDIKLISIK